MEFGKIDYMIRKEIIVSIYLRNGIRLEGTITDQDGDAIMLKSGKGSQLVYKGAMSTIVFKE